MRRNLFHCSNSQQGATDKVTLLFGITIFFKFLLFDFIWSIPTTFASFSTIEFYATKIIATLVLLVPYKFFRLWKTEIVIMLFAGYTTDCQPDVFPHLLYCHPT